jgi:hypothetical protein
VISKVFPEIFVQLLWVVKFIISIKKVLDQSIERGSGKVVHLRVAAGELLVQVLLPEATVSQVGEDGGEVMM